MEGAGWFHDPVTSSNVGHEVSAWGLNVVVLALRLPSPWGGEPLALPVLVRVRYKGELSLVEMAATMIRQLAEWMPERSFRLIADGAYASLVGYQLPATVTVVSRLRRNAAPLRAAATTHRPPRPPTYQGRASAHPAAARRRRH